MEQTFIGAAISLISIAMISGNARAMQRDNPGFKCALGYAEYLRSGDKTNNVWSRPLAFDRQRNRYSIVANDVPMESVATAKVDVTPYATDSTPSFPQPGLSVEFNQISIEGNLRPSYRLMEMGLDTEKICSFSTVWHEYSKDGPIAAKYLSVSCEAPARYCAWSDAPTPNRHSTLFLAPGEKAYCEPLLGLSKGEGVLAALVRRVGDHLVLTVTGDEPEYSSFEAPVVETKPGEAFEGYDAKLTLKPGSAAEYRKVFGHFHGRDRDADLTCLTESATAGSGDVR